MGKKRAREADGKQAASKEADRMDEDSDDEEVGGYAADLRSSNTALCGN